MISSTKWSTKLSECFEKIRKQQSFVKTAIMCDSGRTNSTFELLHCLLTFQRSPEVTDLADPEVVKSPKLPSGQICVSWGLWRSWDRIWDSFSLGSIYGASWPFPMSVRAIDPVYTQPTSPMTLTFPSGMSFVAIMQDIVSPRYSVQNWTETTMVKVSLQNVI